MGLEDREYLRDEAKRYGGGGGSPFGGGFFVPGEWAIRFLLLANVVIFLLQNLTAAQTGSLAGGVTDWLSLYLSDLAHFQIWRLVTYGFCHSGIMHLVFNLYGLWLFGKMIEGIYGSKEFLLFYLTGVVVSGLCHVLFQLATSSPFGVVGASGGVLAVTILAARHNPTTIILFMLVFPMPMWMLAALYVVMNTLMLLYQSHGLAAAAHLGGAAFGYLYYQYHWRISNLFVAFSSPWQAFRLKRKLKRREHELQLFEPNDDELRDEVDRILAQIKTDGEASLTNEQRETLERASRVFRGR